MAETRSAPESGNFWVRLAPPEEGEASKASRLLHSGWRAFQTCEMNTLSRPGAGGERAQPRRDALGRKSTVGGSARSRAGSGGVAKAQSGSVWHSASASVREAHRACRSCSTTARVLHLGLEQLAGGVPGRRRQKSCCEVDAELLPERPVAAGRARGSRRRRRGTPVREHGRAHAITSESRWARAWTAGGPDGGRGRWRELLPGEALESCSTRRNWRTREEPGGRELQGSALELQALRAAGLPARSRGGTSTPERLAVFDEGAGSSQVGGCLGVGGEVQW